MSMLDATGLQGNFPVPLEPAFDGDIVGGWRFHNIPRSTPGPTSLAALASGTVFATFLYLPQNTILNNLGFVSGTTAGATITHSWMALCDSNRFVLAVTADRGSGAIAASAVQSYQLNIPLTTPYTGLYYAMIMVAATTVPTVFGVATNATMTGLPPILCGATASTGQTTPPAVNAQIGAITAGANLPYVLAS